MPALPNIYNLGAVDVSHRRRHGRSILGRIAHEIAKDIAHDMARNARARVKANRTMPIKAKDHATLGRYASIIATERKPIDNRPITEKNPWLCIVGFIGALWLIAILMH